MQPEPSLVLINPPRSEFGTLLSLGRKAPSFVFCRLQSRASTAFRERATLCVSTEPQRSCRARLTSGLGIRLQGEGDGWYRPSFPWEKGLEKKGISTHPCLPGSLLGLPLLWGRGGLILSTPTVGQLPDCPGTQMGLV